MEDVSEERSLRGGKLPTRMPRFVGFWHKQGCLINLGGNYDYLELPYYLSQDYELAGQEIFPSNKQMLDAYVPPLFLVKARAAGIDVADHYISNGYFEPPVIIDPINPFMIKSRIVWKAARTDAVARSMTRNFTYAICCQDIPPGSRIVYFASVLGHASTSEYRTSARQVWEVFRIPLARVRLIITPERKSLMSDISPLPYHKLSERQRSFIAREVTWQT